MFGTDMDHSQDENVMTQEFDIEVLAKLMTQTLFGEYLQCTHCSPGIRISRTTQWAVT